MRVASSSAASIRPGANCWVGSAEVTSFDPRPCSKAVSALSSAARISSGTSGRASALDTLSAAASRLRRSSPPRVAAPSPRSAPVLAASSAANWVRINGCSRTPRSGTANNLLRAPSSCSLSTSTACLYAPNRRSSGGRVSVGSTILVTAPRTSLFPRI